MHINNTNPILNEASPEYRAVRAGRMGSGGGQLATGTVAEQSRQSFTFEELRAALREVGEERYHHQHPFHLLMHEGKFSRGQLQAWALNRYYYQSIIPIKDAIILSRSTDPAFRRAWRKRIMDHDGDEQREWRHSTLDQAGGGDRARPRAGRARRWRFCRQRASSEMNISTWCGRGRLLECVACSLTELFSRDLIALRMERLRQHYPWLACGLDYFEARLTEAPEDAAFAIQYVFDHAAHARRAGGRDPGIARQV